MQVESFPFELLEKPRKMKSYQVFLLDHSAMSLEITKKKNKKKTTLQKMQICGNLDNMLVNK